MHGQNIQYALHRAQAVSADIKKPAVLAAKIAFSALLLLALFRWIDTGAMISKMRGAEPLYVTLSWAFGMPVMIASGLRWHVMCGALRLGISRLQAVLGYMEGIAFNLVLPGAIGGDILRVLRLKTGRAALQRGIASVVFDRLANLFVLALMAAAVLPMVLGAGYVWVWPAFALGAAALAYTVTRMMRVLRSKGRRVAATALLHFMRVYMQAKTLVPVTVLSLIAQTFAVAMMWCAISAVGITEMGPGAIVLTTAVVLLAASLPFTYGGLGLREAAMIWMLQVFGADIDHAASAAFLFTGVIFLQAIPGLGIWFFKAVRPR